MFSYNLQELHQAFENDIISFLKYFGMEMFVYIYYYCFTVLQNVTIWLKNLKHFSSTLGDNKKFNS